MFTQASINSPALITLQKLSSLRADDVSLGNELLNIPIFYLSDRITKVLLVDEFIVANVIEVHLTSVLKCTLKQLKILRVLIVGPF